MSNHHLVTRLFKAPLSEEFEGDAAHASDLLRAATNGDIDALRAIGNAATVAEAATGHTALMMAARAGQLEAVGELLESGAAVNAQSVTGQLSALHLAAEEGATA
eukprot:3635204-Prymnesium_polylepis.1